MLIRFIVENFSSFGPESEFSMVAGRQEIHPEHLVESPGNSFKILRTGLVYGANASGKSNFVKAMAFARDLIVNGTAPKARIGVRPFVLDTKWKSAPSVFQFSFCHGEKCYTYGFKANTEMILNEELSAIVNGKEKTLFERTTDKDGNANVGFEKSLQQTADDRNFLALVARGTRPNQLFLTESIQRNVKPFEPVWQWFARKLVIIFPHTRALGIEFAFSKKKAIAPLFMSLLKAFDTGILDIEAQEIPLETGIPDIPQDMKDDFEREIKDEKVNIFVAGPNNVRYAVRRNEKGELVALKLRACHSVQGGKEAISFDFSEESEGTQRIIDLLPAVTSLLSEDKVVVVDEIDRSLHPHITYALFDLFLREAKTSNSQLIATTHAENLFTFKLLRKDEIWLIAKKKSGVSTMYSLEEFKPRYDKDIQGGYMNGRFGGIPTISRIRNPLLEGMVGSGDH